MTTLAAKLYYTPREVGALLNPKRTGQYVRVRIQRGEIAAERADCGDWYVPWQEVRRLTGQDLTAPGHEGASTERDDKLRELRVCVAEGMTKLARAQQLLAEMEP